MDAWKESAEPRRYESIVMSDATYMKLCEAIQNHMLDEAEEEMAVVKDWVLIASLSSVTSHEGEEQILQARSMGTPLYAVSGLLQFGAYTLSPIEPGE